VPQPQPQPQDEVDGELVAAPWAPAPGRPSGKRYTTVFDAASQAVATIDPLGRRNSTVFDAAGRTKATINGLGFRTTSGYDAASQNTSVTDALGRRSTTLFDLDGRVRATIDALNFRTSIGYDAASRQVTVTNAIGAVLSTVYDGANRVRASVDGTGARTTMAYDAANRRVSVQNPLGNLTTNAYLATGWLRAITDPLLNRTTNSYSAAAQLVAVRDPNNHLVTSVYDGAGRSVATVNALAFRVSQVFDAANRRTAVVDGRANRYSFGYDSASRQIKTTDPLNRVQTRVFDSADQVVVRIDARGNRVSQVYDNAGQLLGIRYPDGTRVTQTWDAVGNRTVLADVTGQYKTLYDNLNRGRAITTPASLTISLTFDGIGRRRTLVEPSGGTFSYGYDLANRNTLVINPQLEHTSWTYDAAGRATVQRLSNLVRVSMAYDTADRLVRLANLTSTGTTLSSFRDTWDGAGNRLHRSEADGTLVSWSYDNSYQLTRERRDGANSYDTSYSYDGAGNRHLKLDNAVTTTYSYDAANQLTKYVDNTGTTTFAFDANGNQRLQIASAGGGTTTNTWDFENRLVKVALPSGVLNTFSYNGDGQRVQRADSTGTLKEVWDGEKILLETNTSNVTQVIYTLSPGVYGDLISQRRLGTSSYYVFDPLGSADRLTNGAQSVTDTYIYKAFGEILLAGLTMNPFRFVGRVGYWYDVDLLRPHVRARPLFVAVGRWSSLDAAGFSSGVNRYEYALNSPQNIIDPSGEVCCIYIWNSTGTGKNKLWGHAALLCGNTYMSFWPVGKSPITKSGCKTQTHDADVKSEGGRQADTVECLDCDLDEKLILARWKKIEAGCKSGTESFASIGGNCATVVGSLLATGAPTCDKSDCPWWNPFIRCEDSCAAAGPCNVAGDPLGLDRPSTALEYFQCVNEHGCKPNRAVCWAETICYAI
jgi:RHS repeat-associated protein